MLCRGESRNSALLFVGLSTLGRIRQPRGANRAHQDFKQSRVLTRESVQSSKAVAIPQASLHRISSLRLQQHFATEAPCGLPLPRGCDRSLKTSNLTLHGTPSWADYSKYLVDLDDTTPRKLRLPKRQTHPTQTPTPRSLSGHELDLMPQ